MRSLSIDQLRALVEVVDLGSFSAAARRLNLTQPAVSLQIRELEARCGLRLVERVGKKAVPTAAGRDLVGHALRIGQEADQALTAMRAHKDGHAGRMHLGTGPTVLTFLLQPVLQGLRGRYPDIDLIVTTGTTRDVVERLLSSGIDLAFTALPVEDDELVATPVRVDEMVAILPANEIAIPDKITPADVDRRTLISEYQPGERARVSRGWMQAGGFKPRPALVFDDVAARIAAVAAGLGMGFIPRPVPHQGPSLAGTVLRPLDPPLFRTLALVQRRGRSEGVTCRVVRNAIMALANLPEEEVAERALA